MDRSIAVAMRVFGPDETHWNPLQASYGYWSRCTGLWKKGIGLCSWPSKDDQGSLMDERGSPTAAPTMQRPMCVTTRKRGTATPPWSWR